MKVFPKGKVQMFAFGFAFCNCLKIIPNIKYFVPRLLRLADENQIVRKRRTHYIVGSSGGQVLKYKSSETKVK
jgi:hypothetical protein